MRINRNSWHYKLIRAYDFQPSESLCPYFWKVVFALVFSIFVVSLLTGGFIVMPIVGLYEYFVLDEFTQALRGTIVLYSVTSILALIIGTAIANQEGYFDRFKIERETKKEDGLITEYFKAVKNKVCPKIEYYED